jgi:hypothetical protein
MRYVFIALFVCAMACRKDTGNEPPGQPACRLQREWANISSAAGPRLLDSTYYSYDTQGRLLKKSNGNFGITTNPVFTTTSYEYSSGKISTWPVSNLPELNNLKNHLYLSAANRPLKHEFFGIGRSYAGSVYQFSDYSFLVAIFHYTAAGRLDSVTYHKSNAAYALVQRAYVLVPKFDAAGNVVQVINSDGLPGGSDTTYFSYDNTPNYYHKMGTQHWLLGPYSFGGYDNGTPRCLATQFSANNITRIVPGGFLSWLSDSLSYQLTAQGLPQQLNSTLSVPLNMSYECR